MATDLWRGGGGPKGGGRARAPGPGAGARDPAPGPAPGSGHGPQAPRPGPGPRTLPGPGPRSSAPGPGPKPRARAPGPGLPAPRAPGCISRGRPNLTPMLRPSSGEIAFSGPGSKTWIRTDAAFNPGPGPQLKSPTAKQRFRYPLSLLCNAIDSNYKCHKLPRANTEVEGSNDLHLRKQS